MNTRSVANAGVHWSNTWTIVDVAYGAYIRHASTSNGISGIGIVLTSEDPYVDAPEQ